MCSTPRKSAIFKVPRSHPNQTSGSNTNNTKSRSAGEREEQLQQARAIRQQKRQTQTSSITPEQQTKSSLFSRILEKIQQFFNHKSSFPQKTIN